MPADTRLGLGGFTRAPYGSFAGKADATVVWIDIASSSDTWSDHTVTTATWSTHTSSSDTWTDL